MPDGQKTRWIVTIEVEMNISDEQVIEEAVDLVRWHYQPKKLGGGVGNKGWYSAKSISYNLTRA